MTQAAVTLYRPWPAAPTMLPVDRWPMPPELPFSVFRIESPYWSGVLKVRHILIDFAKVDLAVRFTAWGHVLMRDPGKVANLFAMFEWHEARKVFVDSISYEELRAET